MEKIVHDFCIEHGFFLFISSILLDQIGLPVPALPIMVAAGIFTRAHPDYFWFLTGVSTAAAFAGHSLCYAAARFKGPSIINFICKASADPEACLERTLQTFSRLTPVRLVWLRLIPGIDILAQAVAAINGMPLSSYFMANAVGSALWGLSHLALGFLLGTPEVYAVLLVALKHVEWCVSVAVSVYVCSKAIHYFLRNNQMVPRIHISDLRALLNTSEEILVLDVRPLARVKRKPCGIDQAQYLTRSELRNLAAAAKENVRVIMICDYPNEASSAFLSAAFLRSGWKDVHVLQGGVNATSKFFSQMHATTGMETRSS